MTHDLDDRLDQHTGRRHPTGASAGGTRRPPPVMTRPGRYALRMVVFLVVIAAVAVALHESAEHFFLRNPPLNGLILSVLAIGIVLSFRAVLSLQPEIAWIERYRRGDPDVVLAGLPPLLGPLAAVLADPARRSSFTATSVRGVLDGVEGRLDERRDTSRYLIALLIFLGLLGTFWGLLMTANSVGETIRGLNVVGSDPAQMFETLRAGLEAPLSGMGTAFSTSLFGLASSLVLGFLDLQASQAQNRFANDLEAWVTGLPPLDEVRGESAPAPSYVTALLQQTAENMSELERGMVRVVDDGANLRAALRALGDRLAGLTEELHARNSLDDRVVTEIRNEIRLLARTLSVIADRER